MSFISSIHLDKSIVNQIGCFINKLDLVMSTE